MFNKILWNPARRITKRRQLLAVILAGSSFMLGCQHTSPIRSRLGQVGDCAGQSCIGCQRCGGEIGRNACSGAACDKPTLAQVVQNAIQPCPDYPAGCMPPDVGAATDNFFGVMGYQAEADDFVFYDFEWVDGTAEPAEDFAFHLNRVVPRLAVEPFPIVVETTGDSELDRARYEKMVQLARTSLQTRINTGDPVILVHHLGPTHKVIHLPQYGPNYSGKISSASHRLDNNGSNQPSRVTTSPVIEPERLAMLMGDLESRIVVGRSATDGQFSDSFGRRVGFTQGGGQGGGGQGSGGQGGSGGGGF